MSMACPGCCFY